MLKKTSVFSRQQRVDECRCHFIQRNDEPVRSCKSAINSSIINENRIPLRHFPDLLHVEGRCPGRVEDQNAKRTAADQRGEGNLPAPSPEPARFLFAVARRFLKNLHRKSFDNLAIDFADKTSSCGRAAKIAGHPERTRGIPPRNIWIISTGSHGSARDDEVAERAEPRYRK